MELRLGFDGLVNMLDRGAQHPRDVASQPHDAPEAIQESDMRAPHWKVNIKPILHGLDSFLGLVEHLAAAFGFVSVLKRWREQARLDEEHRDFGRKSTDQVILCHLARPHDRILEVQRLFSIVLNIFT